MTTISALARALPRLASRAASRGMAQLAVRNMNQDIVKTEYAVRGELVLKSMEYQKQLDAGKPLPFDEIIACNIGNPQALKQKPITVFRQVHSTKSVARWPSYARD